MVRDMELALRQSFQSAQVKLEHLEDSLGKLNPESVLNRGYAILLNRSGKAVLSPDDAPKDSRLSAKLARGSLTVRVE